MKFMILHPVKFPLDCDVSATNFVIHTGLQSFTRSAADGMNVRANSSVFKNNSLSAKVVLETSNKRPNVKSQAEKQKHFLKGNTV